MLMYSKEANNRKQEIDRQHHTCLLYTSLAQTLDVDDENGAVMWTVYDNGNGYTGIYGGDDGKIDSFKSSEVKYAEGYKNNYAGYVIYYNKRDAGGIDVFTKDAHQRVRPLSDMVLYH